MARWDNIDMMTGICWKSQAHRIGDTLQSKQRNVKKSVHLVNTTQCHFHTSYLLSRWGQRGVLGTGLGDVTPPYLWTERLKWKFYINV